MSELYERIPEETPKAFDAFVRYRDLGPTRSLRTAAAGELGLDPTVGALSAGDRRRLTNRKRSYERWSVQNFWPSRAEAWDAYVDVERRGAAVDELRDMSNRQARLGIALQNRAVAALEWVASEGGPTGEGRTIGRDHRDRVILAFAVEGARLERMAYGLRAPGEEEPDGRIVPVDGVRTLLTSDPEVAELAAELALKDATARRKAHGDAASTDTRG